MTIEREGVLDKDALISVFEVLHHIHMNQSYDPVIRRIESTAFHYLEQWMDILPRRERMTTEEFNQIETLMAHNTMCKMFDLPKDALPEEVAKRRHELDKELDASNYTQFLDMQGLIPENGVLDMQKYAARHHELVDSFKNEAARYGWNGGREIAVFEFDLSTMALNGMRRAVEHAVSKHVPETKDVSTDDMIQSQILSGKESGFSFS